MSCKVLILSFILIASITNYMYAEFYEVWTFIFKVIAISGYSWVYFRHILFLLLFLFISDTNIYMLKWLFTPICWVFLKMKWWPWLEMWTLCSYIIYISVIVINPENYLCYTHIDRGTWTPFTSWKPYIQSDRFFCIRGVGQPQIGPHLLRSTVK